MASLQNELPAMMISGISQWILERKTVRDRDAEYV